EPALANGPLEAVLDEVVGTIRIARERPRIPAQGRHAGLHLVQKRLLQAGSFPAPAPAIKNLLLDGSMPGSANAVARGVARLLVLDPEVERPAIVGPDLAAVGTIDEGEVALGLGVGRGNQRGPVLGALVVAVGDA